jgi:hypothetical protein
VRAAGDSPTSRVLVVLHSERAIDRIMVGRMLTRCAAPVTVL